MTQPQPRLGQPMSALPKIPEASTDVPTDEDMNLLIKDLIANPETIHTDERISKLSDEDLKKLAKQVIGDVYNLPCDPAELTAEKKKFAFISIINTRSEYLERFILTGLTGALYQFLHEWTPSDESRTWTSNAPKEEEPFTSEELLEMSTKMYKYATSLAEQEKYLQDKTADHIRICDLREQFTLNKTVSEILSIEDLDSMGTREEMDKHEQEVKENIEALRYGYTYMLYMNGEKAKSRIEKTKKQAHKYPKVKEETGHFNVPQSSKTNT